MEQAKKIPFGGLSAAALRNFAMVFMLLDHLWATIIPGNMWLTYVGRLAFPIFAFQIAEGYRHTHDLKAYKKRLLIFGLISEIPFNFMTGGAAINPFHQNVMFTFILGLLAIEQFEKIRVNPKEWKSFLKLLGIYLLAVITFVDYGGLGVLTVLGFHIFRRQKWAQFAFMLFLNQIWFKGLGIPLNLFGVEIFFKTQAFSLLALPLIWLYNGEKGKGVNIGYWFYPLHMLVLAVIGMMIS